MGDLTKVVLNNQAIYWFKKRAPADTSLVAMLADDADDAARWQTIETWAGATDSNIHSLSGMVEEQPDFTTTPNQETTYPANGTGKPVARRGAESPPEAQDWPFTLDLSNTGVAAIAGLSEGDKIDVLKMTMQNYSAATNKTLAEMDGGAVHWIGGGYAYDLEVGEGREEPGAGDAFKKWLLPVYWLGTSVRVVFP